MRKFSFMPYLDLLIILYYIFTFAIIMIFFLYVILSDELNEQISTTETMLQYSIDSQDDATASVLLERLNILKEKENEYMICKIKYLLISAFMITLILIDAKIYNRLKDKNCWYTNFHNNSCCLIGNASYNESHGD